MICTTPVQRCKITFKKLNLWKLKCMWHKSEKHWRMPRSPSKAYKCDPMQSMMTYFFLSLSTVALPPGQTSTAVRFNRVYSKVTLGSLSVIYFPFFIIPWMDELNHKVNGADWSYRHNTHISSLYQQPPLLCWCFPPKRCQPTVTSLSTVYLFLLFHATNKTYCSARCFIISSGDTGGGWEWGLAQMHIYELNKGWILKPEVTLDTNQFFMSEQEEGKRRQMKGVCNKGKHDFNYYYICPFIVSLQLNPEPNCKTYTIQSMFLCLWLKAAYRKILI